MEFIARRAKGFIYYVSREGVTGMQAKVADSLGEMVNRIRNHTDLPIAVGFGISTAERGRSVAKHADAVVVGSAIVNQIAAAAKAPDLVPRVSGFVAKLLEGVRNS